MKTVQEYLRSADREQLLDALAYDDLCDVHLLLEWRLMTVTEIQDTCKKHMNKVIDNLLSIKVEPSDHMVLYMSDSSFFDRCFNHEFRSMSLIDLNEVRNNIYASSYAFDLTDWKETLGYLVAENKLTQDYITELLVKYIQEITFFGSEPEQHQSRINEVCAELKQAVKDIEEGRTVPLEKMNEDLREKLGMPVDEKDEIKDRLHSEVLKKERVYNRYLCWRERSRILESLGEEAPTFEEAEEALKSKNHHGDEQQ